MASDATSENNTFKRGNVEPLVGKYWVSIQQFDGHSIGDSWSGIIRAAMGYGTKDLAHVFPACRQRRLKGL